MRSRTLLAATVLLGVFGPGAAAASADPDAVAPPVLPAADPFAVTSEQTSADPGGTLLGLLGTEPGGNPADPLTAAVGLSAPPPENPLLATPLLQPQNFRMPAADETSPYPLAPNVAPSPFARIDAWKGVHALIHGGMGRMPGAELGQPLPGTAAPPGSNLPPGLEQFYIEPQPEPSPPPA